MSTTHNSKNTWHERFYLFRQTDITGYSGSGVIAEGVRFEDGVCVIRWCVPDKPRSTVVYGSIVDVMSIHGHAGATAVVWLDTTDEPEDSFSLTDGARLPTDEVRVIACQVDETVGDDDHKTVYGNAEANLGGLTPSNGYRAAEVGAV